MLANGTVLDLDEYKWTVVGPLPGADRGGFAKEGPYLVTTPDVGEAVAKLVPNVPGAKREVLIADSVKAAAYDNVVPMIDSGEHAGQLVIVMPRADISLKKYIEQHGARLTVEDALPILRDIAIALAAIDGAIVHRDLKPANVLRLDGKWCISDFGISKYAGASTEADTRKFSLTKEFAAPEQWRAQTATSKTDVYGFGGIAYVLISGHLPFAGPNLDDFRNQHLLQKPPALSGGTSQLRSLIQQCLLKPPPARPTPANILDRLNRAALRDADGPGLQKLAKVTEQRVDQHAEELQQASVQQELAEEQELLHQAAAELFEPMHAALIEELENSPLVDIDRGAAHGRLFIAAFDGAQIGLDRPARSPEALGPAPMTGAASLAVPFTVISESVISVTSPRPIQGYRGRSHSLWYCDAHRENEFGWYELAFMDSAFRQGRPPMEPYALSANEAGEPLSPVMGMVQVGWPVEELDLDNLSEFVDRWIGWFARAVAGELQRPMQLPEKPTQGTWRTG